MKNTNNILPKILPLSVVGDDINITVKSLLILGIALVNYVLLFGRLKIGTYGGVYSYGITGLFSIALVLLTIFLGIYTKKTLKYSYIAIFYLVLLFFVPQIFANLPIFPYVYRIYGHIDYILHTGHIHPEAPRLGYQTWPGAMFLGVILVIISKIGLYTLLTLPVLSYLINVPIFYLLLKDLTKDQRKAVIGVLFWITAGYGFGWFVPGVLATYLEMVGIYVLFKLYSGKLKINKNFSEFWGILMLLTLTLIFTHLLTSIFWAITIMIFLILSVVTNDKKIQTLNMVLLTIFIILEFYWIFTHTYALYLFKSRVRYLLALFSGALKATDKWTSVAQTGLTQHAEILRIKAYFMYSIVGASLAGMLIVIAGSLKKFIKTRKIDRIVLLLVLLLIFYSIGVSTIAGSYSGEIPSRLFGGSKYIFVIFFTLALKNPKFGRAAIMVLFIFSYLHVLCTYGNMAYDYVAPNEITGMYYTSINIQSKFYTIPDALWDMEYLKKDEQYILPITLLLKNDNITGGIVVVSSRRIDGYRFFTGKELGLTSIRIKSSKIYCSDNQYTNVPSKFEIYYWG